MEINPSSVTLRPFKITDVDDFMSWACDTHVTNNLRWNPITSKEEALAFIRDVCIPHPWRRTICMDDYSIGFVSIFLESGDDRCRGHIGYAVAVKYWNKGIATGAVRMAVDQVFKDYPDLVRLQGLSDVENRASQRVLEKCGFVKEGMLRKYSYLKGQLRDLFMYSSLYTYLLVVDS